MTVISAVISTHCIAISSDSLLTIYRKKDDSNEVVETRKPKIIRVESLSAAFSYWGLAAKSKYSKWTTYNWLKEIAKEAQYYQNLKEYATFVRNELETELNKINIDKKNKGIGIHLLGYENIQGFKIPELFLISNYKDTTYQEIGNLNLSRHLYLTMPEEYIVGDENLTQEEKQLKVKEYLIMGKLFIFNNGDPEIFNPLFNGFKQVMELSKKRKLIKNPANIEIYRNLARRPIEMASKAQNDFYKKNKIIVGGRTHDLVIEKNNGNFSSTSGV